MNVTENYTILVKINKFKGLIDWDNARGSQTRQPEK